MKRCIFGLVLALCLCCSCAALADEGVTPAEPIKPPQTPEEHAQAEAMLDMLYPVFVNFEAVTDTDNSRQPVYTAPFPDVAYRAAEGKAAVSLKSLYGLYLMGQWQGWDIVSYEVKGGTRRIGYIEGGHIQPAHWREDESFSMIPGMALQDTFITIDPEASQMPLWELKSGAAMTLLGRFGSHYAYVETTVAGQAARGFVPIQDVGLRPNQESFAAMQLHNRTFDVYAGGSMIASPITFHEDGTFTLSAPGDDAWDVLTGTWLVSAYDETDTEYWHRVPYVLSVRYDMNGHTERLGMTLMYGGFNLIDGEGSGGYRMVEPH